VSRCADQRFLIFGGGRSTSGSRASTTYNLKTQHKGIYQHRHPGILTKPVPTKKYRSSSEEDSRSMGTRGKRTALA
jgi:hypothetical protein